MTQSAANESAIARNCCDYLSARGYFFWRNNNIPALGRAMPKYALKGAPDIMLILRGAFYGIECKRPRGNDDQRERNGRVIRERKLSPFQAEWAAKCALAGGQYYVVHSVQELKDLGL